MTTPQRIEDAVKLVRDQGSFIQQLLVNALEWPVIEEAKQVEDISFGWTTQELHAEGLSERLVAGQIWQLQPFQKNQPWGIFILEFNSSDPFTTGRGLTSPLRRVLRGLVPKRRRDSQLASWKRANLLFICTYEYKYFRFAYFKVPLTGAKTAPLATFGWDLDVPARTACELNLPALAWPQDLGIDESSGSLWVNTWASAFDVERVTKRFYDDYAKVFDSAERRIKEKNDLNPEHLRLFSQALFNRLMFLRFIERKGWLTFRGRNDYLRALYSAGGHKGGSFYRSRLLRLFSEGLALPQGAESDVFGQVPFLNGGLFEQGSLDIHVDVPDDVFAHIIGDGGLFYRYNFTVEESTPLDIEVAVDPEMLGKIFEELVIRRHESGSYYTPRPVVAFMCRLALIGYLGDKTKVSLKTLRDVVEEHDLTDVSDSEAHAILNALDSLKAIDPACGSGAYLLGLLQELVRLTTLLRRKRLSLPDVSLHDAKLRIISTNLYGTDIDPFATAIATLRLWLSLAVEADAPAPLPNLDFRIETGDSLLGPCEVDSSQLDFQRLRERADQLVALKAQYVGEHGTKKLKLRRAIQEEQEHIARGLKSIYGTGIVNWRIQFPEVMGIDGGFSIVLTNPPYVNMVEMDTKNPQYRARIRSLFQTTSGGFDLFIPFMERGIELLRRNGMYIYIVPNKVLSAEYAIGLRKYFIEHMALLSLTDLSHLRIFDAAVYPIIVAAQRRVSNPTKTKVIGYSAESVSNEAVDIRPTSEVPLSAAVSANNSWSVLLAGAESKVTVDTIVSCRKLAEVADVSGACTVSEAYEWKAAIKDDAQKLYKSNPKRYAPFVVSGNIRPFFNTWQTDKVRYIKDSYRQPVLDKKSSIVSRRRVRQVESSKIVVSGMAKRPTCFWDAEGIAAGKSTVLIIPKDPADGPYLAAVINSSTMAEIYNTLFRSLSLAGGYLRFGPPQMRALPIPEVNAKVKEELTRLVEQLKERRGVGSKGLQEMIDARVDKLYRP